MKRILVLWILVFSFPCLASRTQALQKQFGVLHQHALESKQNDLRRHYPIILQDLFSIRLYLPGVEQRLTVKLSTGKLLTLANIAHPPISVLDLIVDEGMDAPLSIETKKRIQDYQNILLAAKADYLSSSYLSKDEKRVMSLIFVNTNAYLDKIVSAGHATTQGFSDYMQVIKPAQESLLDKAAYVQLSEFKDTLYQWRAQYPNVDWLNLRVVIMGFQQARKNYLSTQFFRKLLKEPDYEKHVVYAEYTGAIYPSKQTDSFNNALKLLAKSDYDQFVSQVLFHQPQKLAADVMGPSAQRILSQWSLEW